MGGNNIKTGSQQAEVPPEVTGQGPRGRFSAGHGCGEGKAEVQPWALEQGVNARNLGNYFYMGWGRGHLLAAQLDPGVK